MSRVGRCERRRRDFCDQQPCGAALATLRYKLKDAAIDPRKNRSMRGRKVHARNVFDSRRETRRRGIRGERVGFASFRAWHAPSVKTHPVRAARIAYVHTWLSTQTEAGGGCAGFAADSVRIHEHAAIAKIPDLRAKYGRDFVSAVGINASATAIIQGLPTAWGNPLPWKTTS